MAASLFCQGLVHEPCAWWVLAVGGAGRRQVDVCCVCFGGRKTNSINCDTWACLVNQIPEAPQRVAQPSPLSDRKRPWCLSTNSWRREWNSVSQKKCLHDSSSWYVWQTLLISNCLEKKRHCVPILTHTGHFCNQMCGYSTPCNSGTNYLELRQIPQVKVSVPQDTPPAIHSHFRHLSEVIDPRLPITSALLGYKWKVPIPPPPGFHHLLEQLIEIKESLYLCLPVYHVIKDMIKYSVNI